MRYTAVFSCVLFVLASCNNQQTKRFDYSSVKKTLTEETENYKLDADYPVFGNEYVDSIINGEIKCLVDDFKGQIGQERISENWKNEQSVKVETFLSSDGNLSILFYNYLFTGGAHGNTMLKSIVLNPDRKTLIELSDIMKGEYFEKLQGLTRKQLKDHLGYEGFVDDGTETLADFSVFVLSNDSISFYFPHYQVAPYSSGIQHVTFVLNEFNNSGTKD